MVLDIGPGLEPSNPSWITALGTTALFTANDGTHGDELWTSDGTELGTHMVKDIGP
jgi:ELWxxDGT repeat protein